MHRPVTPKTQLSQLQNADEAIRTEMCGLLIENKYAEHLSSLQNKVSDTKKVVSDEEKELVQNEESLKREIRTKKKMKQHIDIAQKRLLSELRNEIGSYQISVQEQKS